MSRTDEIKRRLEKVFVGATIEVQDDSLAHAGHAAMQGPRAGDALYDTHRR